MKIKFMYNRIIIAEPTQMGLFDNSAVNMPSSTPPKPEMPKVPQHPYGTPNHKLNFSIEDEDWNDLQPGTPEWDLADSHVKNHFGGKIGLSDLASSYSMPGLNHQLLNLRKSSNHDYESNTRIPTLEASYKGGTDWDKDFSFNLMHRKDAAGNHDVSWNSIRNNDKTAPHLMNLVQQSLPTYQKAGVNGVTTSAVSSGDYMNGAHTWANLGFGFKDPAKLDSTKSNILSMIEMAGKNGAPVVPLIQKVKNATHPFELKDVARKLAHLEPANRYGNRNAKQMWSQALSDYEGDSGAFSAKLSADPNDKGYQRMMSFIKHYSRNKNQNQAFE